MVDTVRRFISDIVGLVEDSYERDVDMFSRWWHRDDISKVYLSQDLFDRLMEEEGLEGEGRRIVVADARVVREAHPQVDMDFVVDFHGHYPIGYRPSQYGLRSLAS